MVEIKFEKNGVKFLRDFVKKGRKSARELTRARILLLANQQKGDTEIAETIEIFKNIKYTPIHIEFNDIIIAIAC